MDNYLAKVLTDQMAQGNKCDGDTWKPQALQAAVTYLNSKLHLNLTKDNIKYKLKKWKKYFSVVSDVQTKHSDDIVFLCGKDRATSQDVEIFEEGVEAMGEEEEIEVNSALISAPRARPSSSTDSMHDKRKGPKKDSLGKLSEKPSGIEIHEVVSMVLGLTKEFNLLKALPDEKKKEWIYFLIDS
ncbi:hypothetical protein Pfo_015199 [Paulownia fortunei]|nr:hypothetical protein Pfo_015199 [Paulownia fortunei]